MALWGNKDAVYLTGSATFGVTNGSTAVTASASGTFNGVDPGDVLIITSGTTTKNRVATKTDSQHITLADNFTGTTAASLAHNSVLLHEQPKYVYQDSNDPGDNWTGGKKTAIDQTFGVDATEASVAANKAKGINTSGWVRYRTYTDAQGHTRHKAETLVAGGSLTSGSNYTLGGDAPDDSTVADA